ncbi:unnamed protein product [Caenorhabditis auriculariae]|uniref:Galectin domain-containing protein n=1 Tax=Caenorhabditis auriculariae TaxID=2777116 RepID=A0A8S1GWL8_9PELO|nr:unnamed protein product [Caenorhabditis auriculariae]
MHKTSTHYTTPPVASRRLRARPYLRWKTFDELFLSRLWGLSTHKVSILNSLSSGDHALVRREQKSRPTTKEKYVPEFAQKLVWWFASKLSYFFDEDYRLELEGFAKTSGLPLGEIVGLNILYDISAFDRQHILSLGCTSIVAENSKGEIFHGRNLDYEMGGLLKNITVYVDFTKGGKILYSGVTFALYNGLLTGQRPGAFTVSLNARYSGAYVYNILMELYTRFRRPVSYFIREVLHNKRTYDEALQAFSTEHLISPSYIVIGGTKSGQGAVVSRNRWKAKDVYTLNWEKKRWFLVETNFDHWNEDHDERRLKAIEELKNVGPVYLNGQSMMKVISSHPVNNNMTIFSSSFSAKYPNLILPYATRQHQHSSTLLIMHHGDVPLPVPYNSRLGQPLQAGQTLNIHGRINEGAQVAELNLLHGANEIGPLSQVILHLKLNFHDKKFIMNTFTDGAWGKEERESMPFKAGHEFDLRIRVLEESLEVSADGKKIHEFKHRLPYNSIEFLQFKGDATLTGVHWGGRFYQIPWETAFPHGSLGSGQRIHLYGVPKGDRWNFDLLARNGDILFHLNPRFKEKTIVRNAHKNGFWEKEEREGDFPLEKERGFDMTIVNEPYSIQIFINNQRFGTFEHRTPNPESDYIGMRIDGDIEMTGIEFSH